MIDHIKTVVLIKKSDKWNFNRKQSSLDQDLKTPILATPSYLLFGIYVLLLQKLLFASMELTWVVIYQMKWYRYRYSTFCCAHDSWLKRSQKPLYLSESAYDFMRCTLENSVVANHCRSGWDNTSSWNKIYIQVFVLNFSGEYFLFHLKEYEESKNFGYST